MIGGRSILHNRGSGKFDWRDVTRQIPVYDCAFYLLTVALLRLDLREMRCKVDERKLGRKRIAGITVSGRAVGK